MAKRYNEKKQKAMEAAIDRELATGGDGIDLQGTMNNDLKASAMGGRLFAAVLSVNVNLYVCLREANIPLLIICICFQFVFRGR